MQGELTIHLNNEELLLLLLLKIENSCKMMLLLLVLDYITVHIAILAPIWHQTERLGLMSSFTF
jgi:hypothetical protein